MKNHFCTAVWAALLALKIFGSIPCSAQVDPWEFEVYPYATTPRGMIEFETANAIVTAGHINGGEGTAKGTFASQKMWYNAYEATYGLTDRIEAAVYLTMAQPNGGRLQWAGEKFRLRGRLLDEGAFPVDIGWYAELEWHKSPQFNDASQELDLRPIISKDLGPITIMLNPKFEKVLRGAGHNQGFEFGYVAAFQYRLSRRLSPGLEFYGGAGLINQPNPVREQQHYIFPSIRGELPGRIEYSIGVGYGLTRGSDRIIFKVNLELERFVGALFKSSPEKARFY